MPPQPRSRSCDACGYAVPLTHGPGNTGQRLAYVRDQIERRGSYEALTDSYGYREVDEGPHAQLPRCSWSMAPHPTVER